MQRLSQETAASSGGTCASQSVSTPPSKQGTKIVINHINRPGVGQVSRAQIGRAVKQRMKFKMLAVIYELHIVLQNKLLSGGFIQKRRRGQLLSCLPWDVLTAVQPSCRVLNRKPDMGEGGKGRIPFGKQVGIYFLLQV